MELSGLVGCLDPKEGAAEVLRQAERSPLEQEDKQEEEEESKRNQEQAPGDGEKRRQEGWVEMDLSSPT